jgi:hypothetical protein
MAPVCGNRVSARQLLRVARCGEVLKFMSLDPDHHVEVSGTLVIPQLHLIIRPSAP